MEIVSGEFAGEQSNLMLFNIQTNGSVSSWFGVLQNPVLYL